MWNKHITLDGKKYTVSDQGESSYQKIFDRPKVYDVGLTGKTIIQDFTISNREPHLWNLLIRAFTNDPWPDNTWGTVDDLLAAYRKATITYVWFNDTVQWTVGMEGKFVPKPQVGAAVDGQCNAVEFIQVSLTEVYT